jgi:hypothetical protein
MALALDPTPEANQELFVFQKIDGTWKIARYCFCLNPSKSLGRYSSPNESAYGHLAM